MEGIFLMRGGVLFLLRRGGVETLCPLYRGRARTPKTFKMYFFVTIVNIWRPLTVSRKNLILDDTGVLILDLLFPLL